VLLLSMPFSSPHYPNLALGLLKPAIEAIGAVCDVHYFSLDYVDYLGSAAHDVITDVRCYMAQLGEWVWSGLVHGETEADMRFLSECFGREHPELYQPEQLSTLLVARSGAAAFIERCLDAVDWDQYAVVGLTTSFQQNMASLALAKRIKHRHPHVLTVLGGANCQDAMGRALHRHYDFLDAVCLGEGDHAFPSLVQRHLAGERLTTPGMVVRGDDADAPDPPAPPLINELDLLPIPDFDAFFASRRASPAASDYAPALVFETARGCWWGARQHCTFCGLNGTGMAFRSKSQERALLELMELVRRYDCRDVANADNILDLRYFEKFIPELAEAQLGLSIYYEVKANLRPAQVAALARAGIRRIQAGIEALDSGLLRLMRKGSTLIANVQLLKLAAEEGIYVEWLALYGFPNEDPAAYARTAALIPDLLHLQPPSAFLRVRADRFSPYFADPAAFGVTLEPLPAYKYLFPYPPDQLAELAYHVRMRSAALDEVETYVTPAAEAIAAWRDRQPASTLCSEDRGDVFWVHEGRAGRVSGRRAFMGIDAAVLRACQHMAGFRQLREAFGDGPRLSHSLEALEDEGFLLRERDLFLNLALRPGHAGQALSAAATRQLALTAVA
jgi:ribosomal peptide maturation radical SAM protein 1